MAVSALVFAFKALLKLRTRLLENNRGFDNLQQNLQDFVASLRASGARPRNQVHRRSSPSLRATLETAQRKLDAFANAGWISRLGDWRETFEEQKDKVLWALITHVAADVIDLDQRQQRALQRPLPGTSDRDDDNGSVLPPGLWGTVVLSGVTSVDAAEAHAFVQAAGVIVERSLNRGPSEWPDEIELEDLPVPDFGRGDAACARRFVRALLVDGVDRETCQELARAIDKVECDALFEELAQLLIEHLGRPGKQAACQILGHLLEPKCCHKNVFSNLIIEALDESMLCSLGVLLSLQRGVEKPDSLAILWRMTKKNLGRRKMLLCLGEHKEPAEKILGAFCGMSVDSPTWPQAEQILRRLGSLRGSSCFRVEDPDIQPAQAKIETMLENMNGLPMTVTVLHVFRNG